MPGSSDLEALGRRFERFASHETSLASPLYERLSRGIADDPELLSLAACSTSEPVPNLFLAAVHFLLLRGVKHPLAAFYPTITTPSTPITETDPYPYFQAFCHEQAEQIRSLLLSRRVQTNEVRRCALLLPAFSLVSIRAHGRPLTLVELGASAGLNLRWDHYRYDYHTDRLYGNPDTPLTLSCSLRGPNQPPLPEIFPKVATRYGIDLQPVDIHQAKAVDWLRALIWPEELQRLTRLQHAIELAREDPPRVLAGDVLDLLPDLMLETSAESVLCLFHCFMINQFSPTQSQRLAATLEAYGRHHDLYVLGLAALYTEQPQLSLLAYEGGIRREWVLANCSGHANWLEWLPDPDDLSTDITL